MTDPPETWHYGLVARWWAEFNLPDPEELAFYQGFVERGGQPALDLACGTGRLLIPMLRAGLDVDGCDLSPDMLALCRADAERHGLAPRLYEQAMHALDLPRQYRTIFICDSFGLGGDRQRDMETLHNCYRQLAAGGALVLSHYLPYYNPATWPYWLPENRSRLPEPWAELGTRKRAANGDEIELRVRLADLDPLGQLETMQLRVELWRGERLIETEERLLKESRYFQNELLAMLAEAGFAKVGVRAGYSERPPGPDDMVLVFVARK